MSACFLQFSVFSFGGLSIRNNFSTSAAICALGERGDNHKKELRNKNMTEFMKLKTYRKCEYYIQCCLVIHLQLQAIVLQIRLRSVFYVAVVGVVLVAAAAVFAECLRRVLEFQLRKSEKFTRVSVTFAKGKMYEHIILDTFLQNEKCDR